MKTPISSTAASRRRFLKNMTMLTGAFQVVPGHVLGLNGATSPNEKLNLAGIGIGGQGASDLRNLESENIVALCDVDWNYGARIFKRYPNAKQFKDYRKMFDTAKEIDGVIVATPDHIHAFASMAAIQMGKHVYCEKPLTHSVWEARKIASAAREHKVATQMGNQGQASEATRRLSEYIWGGAIGTVREAHIWTDRPSRGLLEEYWPQGIDRPNETQNVPSTLDWDLWLGPAPYRPYHPAYLPFRWRGWWDFGTGALGDIGCHSFDPIFRALKLESPLTVEACSTRTNKETFPLASTVTYQFPARGDLAPVQLTWYDGGMRPPRPEELNEGETMGATGALLVGNKGKIILQGREPKILPESRRNEFEPPPKTIPRSIGHYDEWVAACKGGAPGGSNFDWAGPLTETVLLGNVALRVELREKLTQTKLRWDAPNLKITNLAEANQFLRRDYRDGWSL
ncbi:MAG: Gfo/Idh/MocA family oxidoreductase [Verrucomicrobia bacterium]|nr:Gfo/Idh/MocA family oxidoreductase [Verrucomicrobiota bacterium]